MCVMGLLFTHYCNRKKFIHLLSWPSQEMMRRTLFARCQPKASHSIPTPPTPPPPPPSSDGGAGGGGGSFQTWSPARKISMGIATGVHVWDLGVFLRISRGPHRILTGGGAACYRTVDVCDFRGPQICRGVLFLLRDRGHRPDACHDGLRRAADGGGYGGGISVLGVLGALLGHLDGVGPSGRRCTVCT